MLARARSSDTASSMNFIDPSGEKGKFLIPPAAKRCIVGMIKAIATIAGLKLSLPKPDVDPTDLLDAAQGCVGGGGSAGKKASKSSQNAGNAGKGGGSGTGTGGSTGSTPEGRPFTKHYDQDTGPKRNIPGSVVDNTIDNYPGIPAGGGKTAHYDPNNNVTVVTGNGGSIVSAHKRPPRSGQVKK